MLVLWVGCGTPPVDLHHAISTRNTCAFSLEFLKKKKKKKKGKNQNKTTLSSSSSSSSSVNIYYSSRVLCTCYLLFSQTLKLEMFDPVTVQCFVLYIRCPNFTSSTFTDLPHICMHVIYCSSTLLYFMLSAETWNFLSFGHSIFYFQYRLFNGVLGKLLFPGDCWIGWRSCKISLDDWGASFLHISREANFMTDALVKEEVFHISILFYV